MSVFFRVEFKCESCGADILYEDEIPKIYKDRNAITENNKAIKWLKNPVGNPPTNVLLPSPGYAASLALDLVKYILCPVCGERIYFG